MQPVGMDAYHLAHALRLCAKGPMPQKSLHENRRLTVVNVQPHQTVSAVRELWFEEILIVSEQRRAFQPMQQRNDVLVLNARLAMDSVMRRNLTGHLCKRSS